MMPSLLTGVLIICLQVTAHSGYAAMPAKGETISVLDYPSDTLPFVSDNRLLLISDQGKRLVLFDVLASKPENELDYAEIDSASFDFHDVAVSPLGRFAYLVGVELGSGPGLLVRLNVDTFEARSIRLEESISQGSIAVDQTNRIFVGNLQSSTLAIVEDELFEQPSFGLLRRGEGRRDLYLRDGPAFDVEIFQEGRFVVASQGLTNKISLIDSERLEIVDEIGPGRKEATALALATAARPSGVSALKYPSKGFLERQGSVLVGDYDEDVLVLLDIDPYFGVYRFVATADLGLKKLTFPEWQTPQTVPPLILSADRDQRVIVVGRRGDFRVALFSRTGPVLERRNIVELADTSRDIDVSPDGTFLAILDAAGTSLTVIRNPGEWAAEQGVVSGSDEIREAQRLLSELQYPVGVVDGFDGQRTRGAVAIFQESVGLKSNPVASWMKIRYNASVMSPPRLLGMALRQRLPRLPKATLGRCIPQTVHQSKKRVSVDPVRSIFIRA